MTGETVLVTGANGFIGRHLVDELLAAGHEVRAVDRVFHHYTTDGAKRIIADILDGPALHKALQDVSIVYHLAALTALWTPNQHDYERVNVTGTRQVLNAAIAAKVQRFLYCSSFTTMISGPRLREPRLILDDDVSHSDIVFGAYARSKRIAEQLVLAARHQIEPVIVIPSAPIGPGDYNLTAPTCFIRDLVNGKIPAILDQIVNFVDVRALANAVKQAGERGEPAQRYLLAGQNLAMCDFLNKLSELTGLAMPQRQVPYSLAYLAALFEEKILCRLTKNAPKAPFSGVRMAGRHCLFDASKAHLKLGCDLGKLDHALLEALDWLSRNGQLTRTMPALDKQLDIAASG